MRGQIDAICILLKNSTIWRHNDIKLRQYIHQGYGSRRMLEKFSALFCAAMYFGAHIMSGFEVIEGWKGRGALDLPQVDPTRVSKRAELAF